MRNFDRLVTFYLLRAVLYDGLFDKVDGRTADRAIEGLGYGEEQIKAIGGMSNFLKELKKRHDDILKNMPKFPAVLDKNLKMISEKLNLDETQKQILGFLIIVLNSRALENTIGKIEDIHNSDFNKMIAIILNLPQRAVNNALKHDGKLIGSGLLVILSHEDTFCCKYGFINGDFAFEIFENKNYFNKIFLESIVPCGKGDLKSCDYGHIKDELALTLEYLKNAISTKRHGVNILLYGPAGTGKSAYAKYIAKSLNKPLVLKKSSDLINQYIGETEKNIAQAFKEAREKGAVLVFDEVDTFLQDRNNAVRNWEISQVNEMLVQMENFEGIFIATTNLLDWLDSASIRRFDMKIEFSYLKSEQALSLFKKECEILGLKASSSDLKLVGSFAFLTPGDFAAVLRANKFSPVADASEFANRLNDEIRYKKIENERRVGF